MKFSKYEGAGNDFILVDDRSLFFDQKWVPLLTDRRLGIGADGVILLQPDLRMRIFNRDGSEAESCGNGLRCFIHFLDELGFPKEIHNIAIGGKTVLGQWLPGGAWIDMGEPTENGPIIDSGVPHYVQMVESVDAIDLDAWAPPIRKAYNANVTIGEIGPPIRARTFERGVEAETLACGTGAVALAVVIEKLYSHCQTNTIRFQGGDLFVEKRGKNYWLQGPVRRIFGGDWPTP